MFVLFSYYPPPPVLSSALSLPVCNWHECLSECTWYHDEVLCALVTWQYSCISLTNHRCWTKIDRWHVWNSQLEGPSVSCIGLTSWTTDLNQSRSPYRFWVFPLLLRGSGNIRLVCNVHAFMQLCSHDVKLLASFVNIIRGKESKTYINLHNTATDSH